jgi:hypothetical protein
MSGKERFTRMPSARATGSTSGGSSSPGATELLSAPTYGGQVAITVFGTDSNLYSLLIDQLYSSMEAQWFDTTQQVLPVTPEEFRTYCFMAARTRIARVNNERRNVWTLRTNDDWALPSQIANVVNSVGRVFMDETATMLVPVWPVATVKVDLHPDVDTDLMRVGIEQGAFMDISLRMKRIKSHFDRLQGVPVVFVDHIANEIEGDPDVMCLVPAYAAPDSASHGETPVRLHARASSDRMVNGTVAFNYLAWALLPSVYTTNYIGLHPLENPGGRYIETGAVRATWLRLLAKAS